MRAEEKIASVRIRVLKVMEISNLNVTLEEAEKVIETWGKQDFEVGNSYIIEGITDAGRTIELRKWGSQAAQDKDKPGMIQGMLSHLKKRRR